MVVQGAGSDKSSQSKQTLESCRCLRGRRVGQAWVMWRFTADLLFDVDGLAPERGTKLDVFRQVRIQST